MNTKFLLTRKSVNVTAEFRVLLGIFRFISVRCLIGYILTNQISGKRILRSTSRDAYLKNLTGAGKLTDILALY